jgi:hypothetical protein
LITVTAVYEEVHIFSVLAVTTVKPSVAGGGTVGFEEVGESKWFVTQIFNFIFLNVEWILL